MELSTVFYFSTLKELMHLIKRYASVKVSKHFLHNSTCLTIAFLTQGTYSTQIFSLAVLLSSMFIYNQVNF